MKVSVREIKELCSREGSRVGGWILISRSPWTDVQDNNKKVDYSYCDMIIEKDNNKYLVFAKKRWFGDEECDSYSVDLMNCE